MARRTRTRQGSPKDRVLDARPDTMDFRDRMYEATLVEVPQERSLDDYRRRGAPILNQGQEGACTGFGLATVANYLLRARAVYPENVSVSPRMIYEMARRYDEWPGEQYSGSSARGAMKGWHKHGVCSETDWPYHASDGGGVLSDQRAFNAAQRPLGAYYRVNHRDLVAMHAAMAEVGILYATARVHAGWNAVGKDGVIRVAEKILGGHAFAIVAYDKEGFWIQNSWGEGWGMEGFGRVSYSDWLENGTDVWVARLGVPVAVSNAQAVAVARSAAAGGRETLSQQKLRPHIVSLDNNGALRPSGTYGTSVRDLDEIVNVDLPRITATWKTKRVLLYAHGGLVDENSAVQRVSEYLDPLLASEIYPISFVWHSDYWSTLTHMLEDALATRRDEGVIDATKDFLLDRIDDALEVVARHLTGKAEWDEMKENAEGATTRQEGGVRLLANRLAALAAGNPNIEFHVIGHSAGSIFHAPLVELLTTPKNAKIPRGPLAGAPGLGLSIESCTLWAPACHMDVFHRAYAPAIARGRIKRFALYTLTDKTEQDDHCGHIYNKSLLYMVSNAFEEKPRIPLLRDGEPILGMAKFIQKDSLLMELIKKGRVKWVQSPQSGAHPGSTSTSHGGFDDDPATVNSALSFMLDKPARVCEGMTFNRSRSSYRDQRRMLWDGKRRS
jgi:hypothetical protein